jgi:hypothetical protein
MVAHPSMYLPRVEIVAVGMPHRKIVALDATIVAVGDADPDKVTLSGGPAGAFVGAQAVILGLSVERNQAAVAQIRQLIKALPFGRGLRNLRISSKGFPRHLASPPRDTSTWPGRLGGDPALFGGRGRELNPAASVV